MEGKKRNPDAQHKKEYEKIALRINAPNRAIHKTMSAEKRKQALEYREKAGYITPDIDSAPQAEPGKVTDGQYLKWFMELANLPPIDADNPQEMADRCAYYFNFCSERGIRPGFEGLCNALGINMVTMREWEKGNCGSDKANVIRKSRQIIAQSLENLGQTGKINPVTFIFLTKNHLGYRDNTTQDINVQLSLNNTNIQNISSRLPGSAAVPGPSETVVDANFTDITHNSDGDINNNVNNVD